MATEGGWTGFAFVSLVLLAALTGGSGAETTSLRDIFGTGNSPTRNSPGNSASGSNIPGGPLASCPGTLVGQYNEDALTLRVFYSPENGGTNCSSVTRNGTVDRNSYLVTEIRVSRTNPSTTWPDYASVTGARGDEVVTGAYVTGTDDLCITANGKYFPAGGEPVAIVRRLVECG